MQRCELVLVASILAVGCVEGSSSTVPAADWQLESEPSVVIGGGDERPEYLLERVADATRLSDGRIVVADAGSSQVRYFDARGQYLSTATREGEGPGEVQGIIDLVRLPGDTVVVLSYRPGLTYLGPAGNYIRTESISLWGLTDSCRLAEGAIWLLPNRNLLAVADENRGAQGCPPMAEGVHRGDALVLQVDPRSSRTDTIAALPGTERNGIHYRIFGGLLLSAANSESVFLADTRADSIIRIALQDGATFALANPFDPRPIPAAGRSEDVRRWERPDGTVQVSDPYNYPDELPRAARIVPDINGGLWVAGFPEPSKPVDPIFLDRLYVPAGFETGFEWRAVSPEGTHIGTLRSPPLHFVIEVGVDYVLGVTWDEFDVQRVEMRTLTRSAS